MSRNVFMILYGVVHIAKGLALILSLGFYHPDWVHRASLAYARYRYKHGDWKPRNLDER